MTPNPKLQKPASAKEGSLFVYVLSVAWLALTMVVGIYLLAVLVKYHTDPTFAGESMSQAQGFVIVATVGIGSVSLLTAFVPAWFKYRRNQRRRDRLSLRLSGWTLVLLGVEFVVLGMFS